MVLLAITHHNGIRLAELGFLLVAIAGGLLLIGQLPAGRPARGAGGLALLAGGVLLLVATHWGHFS